MTINLERLEALPRDQKEEIIKVVDEWDRRNKVKGYKRYFTEDGTMNDRKYWQKHWEFMDKTKDAIQMYFSAANRIGKTLTGGSLAAQFSSGDYYEGYAGRKFFRPTIGWVVAPTPDTLRQGAQAALLGDIDDFGTGLLPKDYFIEKPKTKHGSNDICSSISIRHIPTGGVSKIYFKTDKQDTESFASAAVDWIWIDELCKWKTYTECLSRIISTKGILFGTGTPEKGLNKVTLNFMPSGRTPKTPDRCGWVGDPSVGKWITIAGWKDVHHLDEKYKASLLATYLPHEIKAKTEGLPSQGTGLVYPISEEDFVCKSREIPPSWPRAFAFDPSHGHAGCIWGAYDERMETWYIYGCQRFKNTNPVLHVASIRAQGEWIRGVFDPSISRMMNHETGSMLQQAYEKLGLNVILAKNDIEGGIRDVFIGLQTGKIKIFDTCVELLDEMRIYSYGRDGKPAREQEDDLCDCLKYLKASGQMVMSVMPDEQDEENYQQERARMYSSRDDTTGY